MSLRLGVKVIFTCEQGACKLRRILHDPIHPCIHLELAHVQCKKEAISCTRFYVQDWRWIGKIFYSNPCELILLHVQDFMPG